MNISFSVAKSFTSALVGIAIGQGAIASVNDPMVGYLPELRGKGVDSVTIRDLLMMSAGLDFVHQEAQSPFVSMLGMNDDTRTTYYPNMRSVALSERPGADPGTVFEYNKKVPALQGMILERTTHRSVSQFLLEGLVSTGLGDPGDPRAASSSPPAPARIVRPTSRPEPRLMTGVPLVTSNVVALPSAGSWDPRAPAART